MFIVKKFVKARLAPLFVLSLVAVLEARAGRKLEPVEMDMEAALEVQDADPIGSCLDRSSFLKNKVVLTKRMSSEQTTSAIEKAPAAAVYIYSLQTPTLLNNLHLELAYKAEDCGRADCDLFLYGSHKGCYRRLGLLDGQPESVTVLPNSVPSKIRLSSSSGASKDGNEAEREYELTDHGLIEADPVIRNIRTGAIKRKKRP